MYIPLLQIFFRHDLILQALFSKIVTPINLVFEKGIAKDMHIA